MSSTEIPHHGAPELTSAHQSRWIRWMTLLILIGLAMGLAWQYFRKPANGSITLMPAIETVNYSDPDHRRQYQGKYFTFTYPGDFKRREETDTVNYPLLERVFLSRDNVEGRKIVVLYQDTGGDRLEEFAAFRIRHTTPSQYFEETIEKRAYTVTLFTKVESVFEVTAFLPHENRVLSLSVTSPLGLSGLREALFETLDSLSFVSK